MCKKYSFLFLLFVYISQVSYSSDIAETVSSEVNEEAFISENHDPLVISLNNLASAHQNDSINTGEVIAIAISIVSLIVTYVATRVLLQQRTAETIRNYLEKYSTKEMRDALRDIRTVDVTAWSKDDHTGENYLRFDQSRRHVKLFFYHVYLLWKSKAITKKCFKVICELKGMELYLTKIQDMDRHVDSKASYDSYRCYEDFCKKHEIDFTLTPPSSKKAETLFCGGTAPHLPCCPASVCVGGCYFAPVGEDFFMCFGSAKTRSTPLRPQNSSPRRSLRTLFVTRLCFR